jgi:hypothetical protein
MGGPIFDRQVFVKTKATEKPPSRSPLPGGLVLVIVAALSAFATYRYVKAGGTAPTNPADKVQIAELQGKLKTMQARVDELERRRRPTPAKHVADDVKPTDAKPAATVHTLLAEDAPHPAGRLTGGSHVSTRPAAASTRHSASNKPAAELPHKDSPAAVKPPTPEPKTPVASSQSVPTKELSVLKGNLEANHEEWQATTDRLGNVVGELDSQRNAIQRTQTGVNYLLERVQRSDVSFTLRKGSGPQHVGPISMELASTSVRGQHYSIRMMVDDKSVELKDRALNEIVQFYTSRSKYPLRLIVSQIERGQVSGTLAVPSSLNQESSSHQLQER